jgi:predicted site-specific integrase-resolvase
MKKIIHKIKVYPKVEKLYEPFYQKRRVAIYARVSTNSDEQLNSIAAQRDYYLKCGRTLRFNLCKIVC